jgi:hypothetical protein
MSVYRNKSSVDETSHSGDRCALGDDDNKSDSAHKAPILSANRHNGAY